MGLAGVKKRTKLSQDPNNTAWSKSTTTFGHKILSRQGWKPGDYLGAENATHSDHFTAANASHIRVMLREENLGLGAQIGKGNAETFGLSMFSGLLGRLNGKSDGEVQKQQDAIRDIELRTFTGQKYGFMNFVSGGLLVGDKMEPSRSRVSTAVEETDRVSKKRKATEDADDRESEKAKKRKPEKPSGDREKASKDKSKRKGKVAETENLASDTEAAGIRMEKKLKREKRKVEKAGKSSSSVGDDEKARLKEEKRIRKDRRRKRKEDEWRKRKEKRKQGGAEKSTKPVQQTVVDGDSKSTPIPPTPQIPGGRQAVRHRYIQQKRLSSMDPQALKEIFMMQAKAAA